MSEPPGIVAQRGIRGVLSSVRELRSHPKTSAPDVEGTANMRIVRFSAGEDGACWFSELDSSYPNQLAGYGLAMSASLASPALEFTTLPEGL